MDSAKSGFSLLALVGLCLLGTVIYSNSLNGEFVFDDHVSITYNPAVKSLGKALAGFSETRYLGNLSFALNYAVAGLIPFGYHVTNVLIHVMNALLVYYFINLIFLTPALSATRVSSQFIAFSTAFIFVAHPIQTQAVSYIVQRYTSFATLFYLLALIFYLKARLELLNSAKILAQKHLYYYVLALFFTVCAMKTKEIAFTLPVALALSEAYFFDNRDGMKKRILYLAPLLLTILIIPLSTLNFVPTKSASELIEIFDAVTKDDRIPFTRSEYLYTQFRVIMTYLRLLVLPIRQHLDYDYAVSRTFFSADVIISFSFLILLFLSALVLFKKYRLASFGIIWFFLTLSIESTVIPIKEVIVEHRLYLPSIGFFLAATAMFDWMVSQKKIKPAAIVLLIMTLSFFTYQRNVAWASDEHVWKDVIAKSPSNPRGYAGLGIVYKKRGDFGKAIELFEKSMSLGLLYPEVFLHLGDIYYQKKDYNLAANFYHESLRIDYTAKVRLSLLNKLGKTYEKLGESEKAGTFYGDAVRLYPTVTASYFNLGLLYARAGQPDKAIETFEKAQKIKRSRNIYYNLALLYKEKGDDEKAIEAYNTFRSMAAE
ncbi:MAG: tetratricopeptide repeat protein [Nitrospirae bacterium]|nr:tetratricopeptide repeat protein [Nitrospirota bacterium]